MHQPIDSDYTSANSESPNFGDSVSRRYIPSTYSRVEIDPAKEPLPRYLLSPSWKKMKPGARVVYLAAVKLAHQSGGRIHLSVQALAAESGMAETSMLSQMEEIADKGFGFVAELVRGKYRSHFLQLVPIPGWMSDHVLENCCKKEKKIQARHEKAIQESKQREIDACNISERYIYEGPFNRFYYRVDETLVNRDPRFQGPPAPVSQRQLEAERKEQEKRDEEQRLARERYEEQRRKQEEDQKKADADWASIKSAATENQRLVDPDWERKSLIRRIAELSVWGPHNREHWEYESTTDCDRQCDNLPEYEYEPADWATESKCLPERPARLDGLRQRFGDLCAKRHALLMQYKPRKTFIST